VLSAATKAVAVATLLLLASCSTDDPQVTAVTSSTTTSSTSGPSQPELDPEPDPGATPDTSEDAAAYFDTIPPGGQLPDEAECARHVLAVPSVEVVPANAGFNSVVGGPTVSIDGADEVLNEEFAPRITGDFSGTTEQVLRWGACKWGFDEDITRARAFTESTWQAAKAGDDTDDLALCSLIGLAAPCPQSYGLLQVKGTVHEGTYPTASESSAFGVDYAMAWLRACFEGSFTWLEDERYIPGDELGCAGVWFSGEWFDQPANDYVGEVRYHLEQRSWETLAS
jgi:hypothetical protein